MGFWVEKHWDLQVSFYRHLSHQTLRTRSRSFQTSKSGLTDSKVIKSHGLPSQTFKTPKSSNSYKQNSWLSSYQRLLSQLYRPSTHWCHRLPSRQSFRVLSQQSKRLSSHSNSKTPKSSNFINPQVITFEDFQVTYIILSSQRTPSPNF